MRRSRTGPEILRLPLGRRKGARLRHAAGLIASGLVACAIAAATGPGPQWVRASVATLLVGLAGAVSRALRTRRQPPHGWLIADEGGLHRIHRAARTTLVEWREPFGVTVLASADRATLLLALTSPRATRYLPASVRDAEDAASAPTVLERATTAAASDLREGDDSALSAADAERLFAEIARRAAASLDRMYLSDAHGQDVVLDRAELRVGVRRIDLLAPLEWRATLFQERGAHSASVCQATWVHQGEVEIVLVAPLPADGTWMGDANVAVRAASHPGRRRRAAAAGCASRDRSRVHASVAARPRPSASRIARRRAALTTDAGGSGVSPHTERSGVSPHTERSGVSPHTERSGVSPHTEGSGVSHMC
jgi:hypothetical protein